MSNFHFSTRLRVKDMFKDLEVIQAVVVIYNWVVEIEKVMYPSNI